MKKPSKGERQQSIGLCLVPVARVSSFLWNHLPLDEGPWSTGFNSGDNSVYLPFTISVDTVGLVYPFRESRGESTGIQTLKLHLVVKLFPEEMHSILCY